MEHWESLCPGGYRFCWDDDLFRPGTDTFLLGSMPRLRPGQRVCDLGCGTGLLSLLLLQRQPGLLVTGVELQRSAACLAERTADANGLTERMRVVCADLRSPRGILPASHFDLCVCNPPYFPVGSGAAAPVPARQAARAEETCTLEDVCAAASYLLRWGGAFCLVYRPERLTDLLCTLRKYTLEPKRIRFVEACPGQAPSLILAEARRGGRPGLAIEPPLVLADDAKTPTAEADAAYFRTKEVSP